MVGPNPRLLGCGLRLLGGGVRSAGIELNPVSRKFAATCGKRTRAQAQITPRMKISRRSQVRVITIVKQALSLMTDSPYPSLAGAANAELRRVERRLVTLSAKH
jgi:hypothetical protein